LKEETRERIQDFLKHEVEETRDWIKHNCHVKGDVTIKFVPKSPVEKDIEATSLYT